MDPTIKGSIKVQETLSAIAAARGLDLTQVGATTTVLNGDYERLIITVKKPHIVEAGHYGVHEVTGKPLADPAVTYYIGMPEAGWIPLKWEHYFKNERFSAAKVGQVVVINAIKMVKLIRYSDIWAARLEYEGFLWASTRQGTPEVLPDPNPPLRWKW
jgi:hypothetical protein